MLNLISGRRRRIERFFKNLLFYIYIYTYIYFFFFLIILSLKSWWHISLCWFDLRHRWVCSGYPQLQQGQCHLCKYRGIVQLLLKFWIQRRWTQLYRCENFSKYDCYPVSGSTTYTTWPSCPQKFWESFFCFFFFFQEHYLITLIMTYTFYLFIYLFIFWTD